MDRAAEDVREQEHEHQRLDGDVQQLLRHLTDCLLYTSHPVVDRRGRAVRRGVAGQQRHTADQLPADPRGRPQRGERERLAAVADDLDVDQPVANLSVGRRQIVAIAKALTYASKILVMRCV